MFSKLSLCKPFWSSPFPTKEPIVACPLLDLPLFFPYVPGSAPPWVTFSKVPESTVLSCAVLCSLLGGSFFLPPEKLRHTWRSIWNITSSVKPHKKSFFCHTEDFCLTCNTVILVEHASYSYACQSSSEFMNFSKIGTTFRSLVPRPVPSMGNSANICWDRVMAIKFFTVLTGSGAYFTTVWQQTIELFQPENEEFGQDKYSPDCSQWFFGREITGGPHFSCYFCIVWIIAYFFIGNIAFIQKNTKKVFMKKFTLLTFSPKVC